MKSQLLGEPYQISLPQVSLRSCSYLSLLNFNMFNNFKFLLNEASWTVLVANLLLKMPPDEIKWFGCLDFEAVVVTNLRFPPLAFVRVIPFCF